MGPKVLGGSFARHLWTEFGNTYNYILEYSSEYMFGVPQSSSKGDGSTGSTLTVLILGVCCKGESQFSITFLNVKVNSRLHYNVFTSTVS